MQRLQRTNILSLKRNDINFWVRYPQRNRRIAITWKKWVLQQDLQMQAQKSCESFLGLLSESLFNMEKRCRQKQEKKIQ